MNPDTSSFIKYIDSIDFENLSVNDIIVQILECKYTYYDINSYKKYYEKLFYSDKNNELNKLKYIMILCLWSKHDTKIDIMYKYIDKYKKRNIEYDKILTERLNNLSL